MSYLARLRNLRKTPTAAWHKLRTAVRTGKFHFFVVFEGEEDEDFYSYYIENVLPEVEFKPVICDGKGGVLAIRDQVISSFGSETNVYFFIDADHDPFLPRPPTFGRHVFVTDGYSVESYCLDPDVILSIAQRSFRLNKKDPLVGELADVIDRATKTFVKRSALVMAYVAKLRAGDVDVPLDELHCADLFEYSNGEFAARKIVCQKLLDKVGCTSALAFSSFREALRAHAPINPSRLIRGKLVSQFSVMLLKFLGRTFSGREKLNGKPLVPVRDISKRSLLLETAETMDIPDSLRGFLLSIRADLGIS